SVRLADAPAREAHKKMGRPAGGHLPPFIASQCWGRKPEFSHSIEFPGRCPDKPGLMKKLFVKSYGCQMNAYDSARIADLPAPLGYGAAAAQQDAALVVLNTCHIREKAAEKVYYALGTLRALKEE